ncbi:hypothetical protein ACP70R_001929 [Stipagrostis hirtigluma subsp. patula]
MAAAPVAVPRMKLGSQGLEVSAQGLGCMGMSAFYGPPKPEPDMIALVRHALLLGKALQGGLRGQVELASKFGILFGEDGKPEFCGDPAYVRAACEGSLKRLGVDCIDLYYQHRIDTRVPIEVTVVDKLVNSRSLLKKERSNMLGYLKHLHKQFEEFMQSILSPQFRWSGHLWSRDVEEDIIPTCRELGIGIVAYSPLGRGFFSSGAKLIDSLSEQDIRKNMPRFQPENLEKNVQVFDRINEMAKRKGCTPPQLALAWVHHQGSDVCPIPGTTKVDNFNQNVGALSVKLTSDDMAELEFYAAAVQGDRHSHMVYTWKNSETPPLSSWKSQ